MKPIAILGCGPAGLMAAHAVALRGIPFVLFSWPVKSKLGGAQFLHNPIPEVNKNEPDGIITFQIEGQADIYQEKVYGPLRRVPFVSMSFIKDGQQQNAWSLAKTYDFLWGLFEPVITPASIDAQWIESIKDNFRLIISSIPLERICLPWSNHKFDSVKCRIYNDNVNPNIQDMTVIYDGTRDRSWYRQSKIFGVGSTEYPSGMSPPVKPLVLAHKPVFTNCDCWPEIVKVGRHGRWEKGILSHDGYFRVADVLQ